MNTAFCRKLATREINLSKLTFVYRAKFLSNILLLIVSIGTGVALGQTSSASSENVPWKERPFYDRAFNSTHDDLYTAQHGEVFARDPFVWGYSAAFAERFRMPRQWIEPGLKGALAVAWRMTNIGDTLCGFGGNPNSCKAPLDCQLDIYYDNGIQLPWRHPEIIRDNVMMGLTSSRFLGLTPESRARRYGIEGILTVSGTFLYGKYSPGGSILVNFDREYEPGVGVFTLIGYGICPKYTGPEKVHMDFHDPVQLAKLARGELKQNEVIPIHVIEFPSSFLVRAKAVYDIENKPNEDWKSGLLNRAR